MGMARIKLLVMVALAALRAARILSVPGAQMIRRSPLQQRRGDEAVMDADALLARARELQHACQQARAAAHRALDQTLSTAAAQEAFSAVWAALDAAEQAAADLAAATTSTRARRDVSRRSA